MTCVMPKSAMLYACAGAQYETDFGVALILIILIGAIVLCLILADMK